MKNTKVLFVTQSPEKEKDKMNKIVPLKGKRLVTIPIDNIDEPEFTLRSIYEPEALSQLAESLVDGMLSPVIVTETGKGRYEIHVGTRRWKASKSKGFTEIPAFVIDVNNSSVDLLMLALTENVQREDLDPFEEARAFLRLVKTYGLTTNEIATSLKKSKSYVLRRLQLLSLPEEVQELVASFKLPVGITSTITRLATDEKKVYYAQKAAVDKLSANELMAIIRKDNDDDIKVFVQSFTSEKAVGRIEVFARWARELPDGIQWEHVNVEEHDRLLNSLRDLQIVLKANEDMIRKKLSADNLTKDGLNTEGAFIIHQQEWTASEINQVIATDRPSDEVLSTRLGKSPLDIRIMRSKAYR